MTTTIDASTLHRTAKLFMDNGRAGSHDEAMALLGQFGLNVHVGPELRHSVDHQNALLTLVNIASRSFLGGIHLVGLPNVPSLSPLAPERSLSEAVKELGGKIDDVANLDWPAAIIGNAEVTTSQKPCWRATWSGWRGGAVPTRDGLRLDESKAMALAPILAAAACASEAFAYHAGDHNMAGRRSLGLSLWNPAWDWTVSDVTEPALMALPSRLWLIGMGNLGQAISWGLAVLPYEDRSLVELVLNDFDRIASSNESTSLLSYKADVNRKKTRVVAEWLEERGFQTSLEERRFGEWIVRAADEPAVALCGVDNALARASLEKSGFGLIVEAGLGGGPQAFRSISVHTFPALRSAEEIWSRQVGQGGESVEDMPAYQALKQQGFDRCGLAQLASRTVGVPFVGAVAASLVLSELLRRLNGGQAYELIASSVSALEDTETIPISCNTYSFGHLPAAGHSCTVQGLMTL